MTKTEHDMILYRVLEAKRSGAKVLYATEECLTIKEDLIITDRDRRLDFSVIGHLTMEEYERRFMRCYPL